MASQRSSRSPLVLASLAAWWVAGCARPVTELVLIVESELAAPEELDRLEISVIGPSGERADVDTDLGLPDSPAAPFTLGIRPAGTRHSPVHIQVVGRLRGERVVERSLRTGFEADHSVEVVVRLERACAQVACRENETCSGGRCRPLLAVTPGRFVDRFEIPIDAGSDAPPPCVGTPDTPERCDGRDQDCDELVDEGFDFSDDPAHCGGCGRACDDGVACLRGTCGDPAVRIVAGEVSTCALRASGHVACWGANEVGQLATGSNADSARPREVAGLDFAVALGMGERHACALARDGRIRCWGWNRSGQLGDGTLVDRDTPVVVPFDGAVALSAGYEHTCVENRGGEVWCWGSRTTVDADGRLAASAEPRRVSGLSDPEVVVAGNESSCAIVGAAIVCWGQDANGRLGNGFPLIDRRTPVPVDEPIAAISLARHGAGFFAIDDAGEAWGWGGNSEAQLGVGAMPDAPRPIRLPDLAGAAQLEGGRQHACARIGNGAQCWGSDARGQLGRGAASGNQPVPSAVVGLPGGIREIAMGGYHSCARTDAEVWCWGANERGQLGDGTFADRARPVLVVLPGATR